MKNNGYSLIEVLIAMSILTVGIMAVISMQTTALNTQFRSKMSSNMQLIAQQIIERINANARDDAAIISYQGLNTNSSAPTDEPAKSDHTYFKSLFSNIPGGYAEISVTNQRPYPVRIRVNWQDGNVKHHLDFDTYILPH
ncbi:MAG: hypothetical protein OHK0040_03560 [bacterium]